MGEQKIKQAGGEIGRNIRRVRLELGMGQTQRAQHELRRALKIERAPQSTTLKSFLPRFFVKKRGKKLLLGETSASPSPSPLGRVMK